MQLPALRDRARIAAVAAAAAAVALLAGLVIGGTEDPAAAAARAPAPAAAASDAALVRAAASAGPNLPRVAPRPAAQEAAPERWPEIEWRRSTALGLPYAGSLVDGVEFPREGAAFTTWDPSRKVSPNPRWRRYGTDRLVRTVLTVLEEFTAAHPDAPRVVVGDLSRPQGGPFYPTHRSHQNGLDADVYFPRLDRQERPAEGAAGIDRELAQDLVDRFVAAGAEFVFVGPRTGLKGPPRIVQPLEHHDRHLHVRIPNR